MSDRYERRREMARAERLDELEAEVERLRTAIRQHRQHRQHRQKRRHDHLGVGDQSDEELWAVLNDEQI